MNKDNAKDYLPLVQAMADGKVIQCKYYRSNGMFIWVDEDAIDFEVNVMDYRVKPQARELWINHYPDGIERGIFHTKIAAVCLAGHPGVTPVLYREVLE